MATYNQVSYGSKGSNVTELQKLLNQNGYNLSEDGIFGKNTQAAVKDYQQKNNLSVDGIVGNNTWGALTKTQTDSAGTTEPTTPTETGAPTFEYEAYKPSDTVTQADALLQQLMAQKPGAYQSTWGGQLNDVIAQILNRDEFAYDLNGDMLYQQYADQYITQGKLAAMDTMGQAAAMTGGYGNSFAQTAGQQAYQAYLQQLNAVVPELYGMALDRYNQEGQDLYNQAGLMAQMEDQEYNRYMDQLTNYYTERGLAQDEARYQAEQDYAKWADDLNIRYGQYRDSVADQQWQAQFDEAKRQHDEQMSLKNGSGSGSGGNGGGGRGYNNGNVEKSNIQKMQVELGVTPDGKWGPDTQAAAKAAWGVTSADDAWGKFNGNPDPVDPEPADPGDNNPGGSTSGFTGSTYKEAAAYLKTNGKPSSGLMDSSTWARHRNSYLTTGQGNAEVKNYSSYQEYLAAYVAYAMEQ